METEIERKRLFILCHQLQLKLSKLYVPNVREPILEKKEILRDWENLESPEPVKDNQIFNFSCPLSEYHRLVELPKHIGSICPNKNPCEVCNFSD